MCLERNETYLCCMKVFEVNFEAVKFTTKFYQAVKALTPKKTYRF